MATVIQPAADRIVCQCLRVSESDVRAAIQAGDVDSVKRIMDHTGAGTGCTACHAAIKRLLAGQCPASGSSPICVIR